MHETNTTHEVLFANTNQAPKDIFIRSLQNTTELAQDMGYDGVEMTLVASRALVDVARQAPGIDKVKSLHEGYPFAWPMSPDPIKNFILNAAWTTIMPPSTVGQHQPGARALAYLRKESLDNVPTVAYPHWGQGNTLEADRRKVALLGGEDVAIQPAADIFEHWGTDTGEAFLDEVEERHFKICFDSFHAQRSSRLTGKPPMSWELWLPGALKRGLVSRVHLGGFRADFAKADPGAVERTDAEMDALLFKDTPTGELGTMFTHLRAEGAGQIKALVVEIPHSGASRALTRNGYQVSQANSTRLYTHAADSARELLPSKA